MGSEGSPPGEVTGDRPFAEGRAVPRGPRLVGPGWSRFGGVVLILSLLVLAGTLVAVQRRVDALHRQVYEIADPTVDMIAEVQYLLARQTSSLRGYLISRDTTFLRQYTSFHARERVVYPRLERFAAELSASVAADVAEVRTLSEQWHRRLQVDVIAAAGAAGATVDAPIVLLEQELYRGALEAASSAMAATQQIIRDWQARIEGVERNGRLVFGFLFLMAGLVAVFISALNTRIRHLAAEAETRRREVERAMERSERAVAERGYLMRGFTHDVKNPLNVADGYADLLELGYRGDVPPGQLELVGRIRSAIRDTVEVIDRLLEISRLESDGLRVERHPVDLRALASQVVEDHMGAAHQAGLDLRFIDGRDPGGTATTRTDADRVGQVLKNLVLNALKYTPSPGNVVVRLEVPRRDADHRGTWARVAVTDSGPGVPLEEQERIFYEFHRVPGAAASGHGLGLAISRRIARLLGGDVTVRSVPGEGATFELWLPVEEEEVAKRPSTPASKNVVGTPPDARSHSTDQTA